MRHARRWLINGVAALSLLFCGGAAITWAESGNYLLMHASGVGHNNARIVSINHGILQYISSLRTHRSLTSSVTFVSREGNRWPRYEWDQTWRRDSAGTLFVRLP